MRATAPRRGRRQLERLTRELSARDLAIVATVAKLKLVSTGQLERLHFADASGGSRLSAARRARRTLERLVGQRLLVRVARRIGGIRAGSASFVYAIAPAGQRVVNDPRPRQRFREPSVTFLAHTLAVSELYVRLRELQGITLEVLQAEPGCWRTFGGVGGQVTLKPDLFVQLVSQAYEYRWFIEVDLGSEHQPALIRKCQTYESYYQTGVEQAGAGLFPRVVWVVPDEQRAQEIERAIRRSGRLTPELFLVVTTDAALHLLQGGRA